ALHVLASLHRPAPHASQLFPYTTLFRSNQPLGQRTTTCLVADPIDFWIKFVKGTSGTFSLGRSSQSIKPYLPLGDGCSTHSAIRSAEHTSELQSRFDLVSRLLLEEKEQQ